MRRYIKSKGWSIDMKMNFGGWGGGCEGRTGHGVQWLGLVYHTSTGTGSRQFREAWDDEWMTFVWRISLAELHKTVQR